ncbi:MAG: hypothetical protein RL346_840 [Verrucomicrobiota bacterium]
MKIATATHLMFAMAIWIPLAVADTIVLNNGESFEGKLISEDATHYIFELQVTKSIKDERKFLKSEIKSVTKRPADLEDFDQLKDLVPVPDLIDVAGYQERLKKLSAFAQAHPKSSKLREVKAMQENLEQEMAVVTAGGFKLAGLLVSQEAYLADAYAYDQKILVKKIQHEMGRRNFIGALRLFSQFEASFSEGKMREELISGIRQVLTVYRATLADSLATYDARMKEREEGLVRMSPENRADTELAIAEEMTELRNRFTREKAEKNPWITPHANLKETMIEAMRQADAEIRRLDAPSKRQALESPLEEVYRNAWLRMPTATAEDRKLIMENAKRDRMPVHYLNKLEERKNTEP